MTNPPNRLSRNGYARSLSYGRHASDASAGYPIRRPTEEAAVTMTARRAAIRRNLACLHDDYTRVLVLLSAIGFRNTEIAAFAFGIQRSRVGQIIRAARRKMEAGGE